MRALHLPKPQRRRYVHSLRLCQHAFIPMWLCVRMIAVKQKPGCVLGACSRNSDILQLSLGYHALYLSDIYGVWQKASTSALCDPHASRLSNLGLPTHEGSDLVLLTPSAPLGLRYALVRAIRLLLSVQQALRLPSLSMHIISDLHPTVHPLQRRR